MRATPKPESWTHIARGLCGWYGEADNRSISAGAFGYGDDPEPRYPIADGALLIDKSGPLERDQRLAYVSPMLRQSLKPGECERLPEVPILSAALKESGNAFGELLKLQDAHKAVSAAPGPLDHVGEAEYAAWWRARGARVGRWVNGAARWEQ